MNQDEEDLILHTMKSIADAQRRHNQYIDDMLDMMFKELQIGRDDATIYSRD